MVEVAFVPVNIKDEHFGFAVGRLSGSSPGQLLSS